MLPDDRQWIEKDGQGPVVERVSVPVSSPAVMEGFRAEFERIRYTSNVQSGKSIPLSEDLMDALHRQGYFLVDSISLQAREGLHLDIVHPVRIEVGHSDKVVLFVVADIRGSLVPLGNLHRRMVEVRIVTVHRIGSP